MIAESFVILLSNRNGFDRTKDWLGYFGTDPQATDAIYSLNKGLVAAGKMLSLSVSAGTLPEYGD